MKFLWLVLFYPVQLYTLRIYRSPIYA